MSTAEQWRTFAREAETNAFDYQHGTVLVSARSIANLWQTVARMSEQLARQVEQAEALRRIRPEPITPVAELPSGGSLADEFVAAAVTPSSRITTQNPPKQQPKGRR